MYIVISISVKTFNHFESNGASATDKENDMRHIPRGTRHIKYYINSLGSSKDFNQEL